MFKADRGVLKEAVRRKEEAAKRTAESIACHLWENSLKWIPIGI
jgi:hypothetical protein